MRRWGMLFLLIVVVVAAVRFLQPKPRVYVHRQKNGHYQLKVEGKPYIVKGVCYSPVPIGKNWGYDLWHDPALPWQRDGDLMQAIGANTVRFYQAGEDALAVRGVIKDLYERNGIRTILGHWMGLWGRPDYASAAFRNKVKQEVLGMVRTYKNEEGLLLWILGNENNTTWEKETKDMWTSPQIEAVSDPAQRKRLRAETYYSLVGELAREIKKIDKNHPIALGNADLGSLEVAREYCKDIDLLAAIVYRGKTFGNFWRNLSSAFGRPALISEFGCDSLDAAGGMEDEKIQAEFIGAQWEDIRRNLANESGEGNALGGCIFEWTDEWWKHNEADQAGWAVHDKEGDWSNGSYYFDIQAPGNLNMNEEYFGIVALAPEMEGEINSRQPKEVYAIIKNLWE